MEKEMLYDIVNKAQKYEELLKFPKDKDELHCSFCGHSQSTVELLVAGPGVFICDKCVDMCSDIIEEHRQFKDKGAIESK